MATNAGEWSSVQRPSSTSSGVRRSGLSSAARDTLRQKSSSAARAPSAPPAAWPSASTAAFMAPADVPEMPSIAQPGLLEQPIQHAPGEGAMRAPALQRQIHQNRIASHDSLALVLGQRARSAKGYPGVA